MSVIVREQKKVYLLISCGNGYRFDIIKEVGIENETSVSEIRQITEFVAFSDIHR